MLTWTAHSITVFTVHCHYMVEILPQSGALNKQTTINIDSPTITSYTLDNASAMTLCLPAMCTIFRA